MSFSSFPYIYIHQHQQKKGEVSKGILTKLVNRTSSILSDLDIHLSTSPPKRDRLCFGLQIKWGQSDHVPTELPWSVQLEQTQFRSKTSSGRIDEASHVIAQAIRFALIDHIRSNSIIRNRASKQKNLHVLYQDLSQISSYSTQTWTPLNSLTINCFLSELTDFESPNKRKYLAGIAGVAGILAMGQITEGEGHSAQIASNASDSSLLDEIVDLVQDELVDNLTESIWGSFQSDDISEVDGLSQANLDADTASILDLSFLSDSGSSQDIISQGLLSGGEAGAEAGGSLIDIDMESIAEGIGEVISVILG